MEWLTQQLDLLQPYFVRPHPVAVAAAVAVALFWTRAAPELRPGRPGAWFGLVLGAAAYAPLQVWVLREPTVAAIGIIRDSVGDVRMADLGAVVGVVEAVISGYGTEIVKLALMLVVLFAMGYPRDRALAATAGVAPAAGLAMFAAVLGLTQALEGGAVEPTLAYPFVQQTAWVGLHIGTGLLLSKGWVSGRLGSYALYAGVMHAAAAYTVTLAALGWHPVIVTLALAAVALATFTGGASAVTSRA